MNLRHDQVSNTASSTDRTMCTEEAFEASSKTDDFTVCNKDSPITFLSDLWTNIIRGLSPTKTSEDKIGEGVDMDLHEKGNNAQYKKGKEGEVQRMRHIDEELWEIRRQLRENEEQVHQQIMNDLRDFQQAFLTVIDAVDNGNDDTHKESDMNVDNDNKGVLVDDFFSDTESYMSNDGYSYMSLDSYEDDFRGFYDNDYNYFMESYFDNDSFSLFPTDNNKENVTNYY